MSFFSPQKYIFHEPTFLFHISRKGKWGPFNTDEWLLLKLFFWSTQTEHNLLVVSFGVFL